MRLQLLQGVVAHHMGDRLAALRHLQAAQRMWQSLQVSCLMHAATTVERGGSGSGWLGDDLYTETIKVVYVVQRGCAKTWMLIAVQLMTTLRSVQPAWSLTSGCFAVRIQVPAEALTMLQEMGYHQQEATRALRFAGADMSSAVTFLTEQRALQQVGLCSGGASYHDHAICLCQVLWYTQLNSVWGAPSPHGQCVLAGWSEGAYSHESRC